MRICLTFYRTLVLPLIGISIICAFQVLQSQTAFFVFRVVWVKFLTSIVIAAFIVLFRSEQFIFYNNLGYSRTRILLFAFLLDFVIWFGLMMLTVWML